MTKTLSCREIGGQCDCTVSGESNDDIREKMYAHAADAHPEALKNMSDEQKEQMNQIMDQILTAK